MSDRQSIQLTDGRSVNVETLKYPVDQADQMRLIRLQQSEWTSGDVDWLESLRGSYSDMLNFHTAVASHNGEPISSSTVVYPVNSPEVCVIEGVVTLPEFRRQGLAARLTDQVVNLAFESGCKLAYLGNDNKPNSVYERIGFRRIRGAIMRRPASGFEEHESLMYAPDQDSSIRPTQWGDLPAMACLIGQELNTLLVDYRRGLVAVKHASPQRCVSNFGSVWYDVQASQGVMLSLIGESDHRVLGFGTVTTGPGPLANHTAVMDATTHDHFADELPALIDQLRAAAVEKGVRTSYAYLADVDKHKIDAFTQAGFSETARLPDALRTKTGTNDLTLLRSELA